MDLLERVSLSEGPSGIFLRVEAVKVEGRNVAFDHLDLGFGMRVGAVDVGAIRRQRGDLVVTLRSSNHGRFRLFLVGRAMLLGSQKIGVMLLAASLLKKRLQGRGPYLFEFGLQLVSAVEID